MKQNKLEDLIDASIYNYFTTAYFAMPCLVVAVTGRLETQQLTVQPSIDTKYRDGTSKQQPVIQGVPVIFPASRTSMLSFPISVGDTVLCVFSQRDTDNFKLGSGGPTPPNDFRRFSQRDAIAIPGLFPFSKAMNNPAKRNLPHSTYDAVLTHNIGTSGETELRLKENGDIQITSPTKLIVTAPIMEFNAASNITFTTPQLNMNVGMTTWTGDITQSGDYSQTGTYTLSGININLHKHGGVTPGMGVSGVPTN